MRTIADIPQTPFEQNSDFPDGGIINETISQEGTAVVREIYNDPLVNLYKIMRTAGVIPNNIEDSESNGYQLLTAFQKLPNVLNDVEQQLTLIGSVFSINLDITLLPDKYFLFAKAAGAYTIGSTYTFKGSTGSPVYNFTSPTGFKVNDELLLVLDQTGVRAYSLSANTPASTATEVFAPFGTPIAFNNTSKIWYQSEGLLFSDLPEVYDLQAAIRTMAADGSILVYEMCIAGHYLGCTAFSVTNTTYAIYRFDLNNLATAPIKMSLSGTDFPAGTDHAPFAYLDGTNVYITNATGTSANDYLLNIYTINFAAGTLTYNSSVSLATNFKKTTNVVIVGNYLYTFIAGLIEQYSLLTGAYKTGPSLPGYIGNIFALNGNIYYSNGEVAKKWSLPVYS